MIDTHCHLNDLQAFPDTAEAIQLAVDQGVKQLIVIGIDTQSSQIAVEIADRFDQVYACVGWHPTSAAKYNEPELRAIQDLASHPKVVGIGEIGLDYHWDYSTPDQQDRCLRDHLDLARELDLPVAFHCREAYDELLALLETQRPQPYLLHCFAGNADQAQRALNLGAIFGVDGPVTYKKADELRSTLKQIGLNRLVLETDAPWLSPVPYRGKPNHPAYLPMIAQGVADLFEVERQHVADQTTQTAQKFFHLPAAGF